MEESGARGAGAGTGRKKLKHRLAAILSVFSRRAGGGGRKRRDNEGEAKPPPPLAFPSYSRLGSGKKQPGGGGGNGNGIVDRRLSLSAPRVHITIDCAGRRSVDAADPSLLALDAADAGRKAERRSTAAGGLPHETGGEWEGRKCPPSSPFVAHLPPLPPVARWKERASTNTNSALRRLVSSSSSDDEYDEDSRNLFSSRSFSSDSSDFYNCPRKNTTTTRARASVSGPCRAPPAPASAARRRGASQSCRYSFELPRGSTASAATDGGFAVVKRSADPYEDFRKSMQEMIAAEWPAAGGDGEGDHSAERLLETYLVLNSPRHYPAILAAFADVRDTLFP
ncbi:unnamed protein product [Miscanthus lutarioriparius]|uniref:Transcription repressor n=1 Tax=Miscanthus lutarioriparius TaxID=422564 RepID=A0A811P0A9_9POAL|nr:unnamed protein product [Miscanthus lutarioriparius]